MEAPSSTGLLVHTPNGEGSAIRDQILDYESHSSYVILCLCIPAEGTCGVLSCPANYSRNACERLSFLLEDKYNPCAAVISCSEILSAITDPTRIVGR